MANVLGFGGVFFKSADPAALQKWYVDNLHLPETEDGYVIFDNGGPGSKAVWTAFPADTDYFEPTTAPFMVNYRVDDLDGMLEQLRAGGADVDESVQTMEGIGRFGWARDPEGNRFELWEPESVD